MNEWIVLTQMLRVIQFDFSLQQYTVAVDGEMQFPGKDTRITAKIWEFMFQEAAAWISRKHCDKLHKQ